MEEAHEMDRQYEEFEDGQQRGQEELERLEREKAELEELMRKEAERRGKEAQLGISCVRGTRVRRGCSTREKRRGHGSMIANK